MVVSLLFAGGDHSMKQRAFVFVSPQTPDNFLSIYMAGSLSIVELDEWVTELWLHHGILLYPSNSNRITSNNDRFFHGPDEAA